MEQGTMEKMSVQKLGFLKCLEQPSIVSGVEFRMQLQRLVESEMLGHYVKTGLTASLKLALPN